ncbi:BNR repeat-containing protein [Cytophagaceae bacterium DM2B3-1]|uniref:BNR repeat-containing protein n=1 Tax=Xanthocytophaga flava TaxID=3048013 RepID=A0ABT7CJK8_9BACT|nr:BNR repeat-containing protein [Xanthocytophaga flavus]MDJ1493885.1 BNR repeat-containing protein [Xanthocytophaga flavus]
MKSFITLLFSPYAKSILLLFILCLIAGAGIVYGQKTEPEVTIIPVGKGWASNSVNTVIFRRNALVTHGNYQYIAFYDSTRHVVLGKRKLKSKKWELVQTIFKGNAYDAHNCISIMVDGEGYLHLSWDHHDNQLRYAKSITPGSLTMTYKLPMTGVLEEKVSYPQFYRFPDGNLLFSYRNGASGRGNLVINKYFTVSKKWQQITPNLIDGEGKRNAYSQTYVDPQGTIHISWVWRESPNVASNHDMCYARSTDGGLTWEKSTGEKYQLPIKAASAEYVMQIPQNSELINQTSMFAGADGYPFIASYWRDQNEKVPQFRVIYYDGNKWNHLNTNFRKTPFSLSGGGTKRIPISRPYLVSWKDKGQTSVAVIFRDEERGSKVSVAICQNINSPAWEVKDLSAESVGSWEPAYDTELWKHKGILDLFVQKVEQTDAEGISAIPAQEVQVMEVKFGR